MDFNSPKIFPAKLPTVLISKIFLPPKFFTVQYIFSLSYFNLAF